MVQDINNYRHVVHKWDMERNQIPKGFDLKKSQKYGKSFLI